MCVGSKCQVLQITKKAKPLNTKYILHNVELESVPAVKYLGVTIADDLSWSKHIDITTKKANQTLGFLKRNIRVHNKDLKSVAYKTLVRPQLEYASTVCYPPHHNRYKKKANSTNLYPPTKGYLRETCKSQNINPIYLTLSSPTVSFRS